MTHDARSATQSSSRPKVGVALRRLLAGFALAAACAPAACGPATEPDEAVDITAAAIGAYDQCAHVLDGDLFNKITSNHSSAQAARTILRQTLLSMSEDQAYDRYQILYDEYHKAGGGGGFNFNFFGLFGLGGNGGGGNERKLTRQEFREQFRLAKRLNASSNAYDWSSSSSLASGYASYIRDPETIRAWRDCVTSQPQPGLYAFGSRDDAGNAYVQVVWAPGPFAGIAPAIDVSFVPQAGYRVVAPRDARVAVGTGAIFGVESPNEANAIKVTVNGAWYDDTGRLRGSFSSVADIPPVELPHDEADRDTVLCEAARKDALRRGELTAELFGVYQRINYAPEYAVAHDRNSEIIGWGECQALVDQL